MAKLFCRSRLMGRGPCKCYHANTTSSENQIESRLICWSLICRRIETEGGCDQRDVLAMDEPPGVAPVATYNAEQMYADSGFNHSGYMEMKPSGVLDGYGIDQAAGGVAAGQGVEPVLFEADLGLYSEEFLANAKTWASVQPRTGSGNLTGGR
jgi:hypothetical protein